MRRLAQAAAVLVLTAVSVPAFAQEPAPAAPAQPRVEVGFGGSFTNVQTGLDTSGVTTFDTRVGVLVSGNWSLEGIFNIHPADQSGEVWGFYRIQALWRHGQKSLTPFVGCGVSGQFARYNAVSYTYVGADGSLQNYSRPARFNVDAPIYPTFTVGVEKILASHLKIRAELATALAVGDALSLIFQPSFSVSIPIGRYATSKPR